MIELVREKIEEIYSLLGDDISRKIFENRVQYSITEDASYLREVVCSREEGKVFYQRLRGAKQPIVIFGAGYMGKRIFDIFTDIEFACFVDNYKTGELCGKKVVNIEELKKDYQEPLIVIALASHHEDVYSQLLSVGFKRENIINLGETYDKLKHLQYFDLDILTSDLRNREVFVDGGCYDGMNSLEFIKWCSSFEQVEPYIYAWEPDSANINRCKMALSQAGSCYEIVERGLWSKEEVLHFSSDKRSSAITENGEEQVMVDSIDNRIEDVVTYIKMDIEGAEYQALLGAENTIKEYRPRLAICVYHKPEDIWEIPGLIHKLDKTYRFYLRHYSFMEYETVLYAI